MNRKLKLDLDSLTVDSFAPASADGGRGTVLANSLTEPGSDSYGEDTCGWTMALDCDRTQMLCYTLLNCETRRGGGPGTLPGDHPEIPTC